MFWAQITTWCLHVVPCRPLEGTHGPPEKDWVGLKRLLFFSFRARRRRLARRRRRMPSSPSPWGRCSYTSRPARGSVGWVWTRTPPWVFTRRARCGPSRPARWRGWWSTWCRPSGAKTPPTSPSSSAPTDPSPPPSRCWISCSTGKENLLLTLKLHAYVIRELRLLSHERTEFGLPWWYLFVEWREPQADKNLSKSDPIHLILVN